MVRLHVLALAMAWCVAAGPAAANPVKSLYTTVELSACKRVSRHRDGGAWLCKGLDSIPVYVAEGDLRHFVSAGTDAGKRRAATQTLGPFNSIFERGSDRATIEWRFDRRGDHRLPYAIIVRFHTSNEGRRGDVMVVMKVTARETCHVAHIDALANQNAITLARFIADEKARGFDCRDEPRVEGATGRSPM